MQAFTDITICFWIGTWLRPNIRGIWIDRNFSYLRRPARRSRHSTRHCTHDIFRRGCKWVAEGGEVFIQETSRSFRQTDRSCGGKRLWIDWPVQQEWGGRWMDCYLGRGENNNLLLSYIRWSKISGRGGRDTVRQKTTSWVMSILGPNKVCNARYLTWVKAY